MNSAPVSVTLPSAAARAPVLLLMDSPTKQPTSRTSDASDNVTQQQQQQQQPSLGQLLVDMTAQVQDERSRRSDVEKRNHALMLEIEQLQNDMLDLRTSHGSDRQQQQQVPPRSSDAQLQVAATHDDAVPRGGSRDESADFWWRELQEAKKVKERALVEAHQRAMQVMELNACISMQHDELKALRVSERDACEAVVHTEEHYKALVQQTTILQQENRILTDDVLHLNTEIGKRGVHFKTLMDKWTEAQAQSEHLERENHAMLERMKDIRQRSECVTSELEKVRDERDCLQHHVNHLKGAVAAKAAESKAFQVYGSSARDQLQLQAASIQRHHVLKRKIHHVARDAAVTLRSLRGTLATIRSPLVAIQHDFRAFLSNLQKPVASLVTRSRRFAEVAHAEHQPLRGALLSAELARRHLHDQLWRSRRNALLICQIRNHAPQSLVSSSSAETTRAGGDYATADDDASYRALRANYATGELFLKASDDDENDDNVNDRETLRVKCDSVYSDRAREWSSFESVTPLVQSVLDGCNACVATFETLLPLQTSAAREPMRFESVPALVLRELFDAARVGGARFHRMKISVSYLGVYNECVYDLLGLDATSMAAAHHDSSALAPRPAAAAATQIVVLEVQNLDEALLVLLGGLENLASAHASRVIDTALTHKVVTICLTYDNLLSGAATATSKLQAPECQATLAARDTFDTLNDDRSKRKALVTMENGVHAFVSTLADVRTNDPAFVRYHSSKLTVLLQDTIKASAKFLALVALPAQIPVGDEARVATVLRALEQLRRAVACGNSATASPFGTAARHDRSLEGFMSRFAQQTQQQTHSGSQSPSALSLQFSSSDIQERSRQALSSELGADAGRWEDELDSMTKRYGADVIDHFATSFFAPNPTTRVPTAVGDSTPMDTRASFAALVTQPAASAVAGGNGSASSTSDDDGNEWGGDATHDVGNRSASVNPHAFDHLAGDNPPPAPIVAQVGSTGRRSKSASSRRSIDSSAATSTTRISNSKSSRASSARSMPSSHGRTLSDKKFKTKQQYLQHNQRKHGPMAATAMTPISRTGVTSTSTSRMAAKSSSPRATTLAPTSSAATAPMLKIRRETASSALKKSRLAALVVTAATPSSSFVRQQQNRTPFK